MTGTEKQLKWANDILTPVRERIARFPTEIRGKHEQSLAKIESAATVIRCREQITSWCDRVDEWLECGTFQTKMILNPKGFDQPSVIRSVVI